MHKAVGLVLAIVGVGVCAGWQLYSPGWDSLSALVLALPAMWNSIRDHQKNTQSTGGRAIALGKGARVDIKNEGTIAAGSGGNGGTGGDAIHVAEGVKVTIVNRGHILGGDAGNS